MNWKERNIDHYRILDDPWFMLTTRSRELPPGETVTEFIVHESQPQRCLTVYSGIDMVQQELSVAVINGVVEFCDFLQKV